SPYSLGSSRPAPRRHREIRQIPLHWAARPSRCFSVSLGPSAPISLAPAAEQPSPRENLRPRTQKLELRLAATFAAAAQPPFHAPSAVGPSRQSRSQSSWRFQC